MRKELHQAKLTLSRLNDLWSFTGKEMTYKVPLLLRLDPDDPVEALLCVVTAYGCVAAHAGLAIEDGIKPDETWDRLFKQVGQAVMFDLPSSLKYFQKKEFEKKSARAFTIGWGEDSPSPP